MASIADVIVRTRIEGDSLDRLPVLLRRVPDTVPIRLTAKDNATPALNNAERAQERLAQSSIALARAQGNYAQAISIVDQRLSAVAGDEERVNRLLVQRIRLNDQAAASAKRAANAQSGNLGPALPRTLDGLSGSAATFAKTIVGATAGLVAFDTVAGQVRNSFNLVSTLDNTQRSLGVLVGSQERANEIMQDAAEFGQRYRITQQQIGEAVRASGTLIRDSTVGTEKALEVLTRLTAISPGKTFDDAARSVRELASGDYVSIADQFNIGKKAALELRDAVASGQDVFKVLDQYLNDAGASAAILGTRLEGAQGAANNMAVATEKFNIALGKLATSGPVLDFINGIADALNNAAIAANAGAAIEGFAARALGDAGSYDAYVARINEINGLLPIWTQHIEALTPAQYQATQLLMQQGMAADTAIPAIQGLATVNETLARALDPLNAGFERYGATLQTIGPQLLATAAYNDQYAATVDALILGLTTETVSINQVYAALDAMRGAQEAQTAAQQNSTAATEQATNALAAQAAETLVANTNAQTLAATSERLQAAVLAAAGASGTLESRAAALAQQFGITTQAALGLLQATQALALATNSTGGAYSYMVKQSIASGKAWEDQRKAIQGVKDAQSQAILATGTEAQRLKELIRLRDQYAKGSAEYIRANTAVVQQQQAMQRSAGTAGTAGTNDAQRAAEERLAAQRALMNDQQLLNSLTAEYNRISNKGSTDALRLEKQIRDVRARMAANAKTAADEREREAEAARRVAEQEAARRTQAEEALMSDQQLLAKREAEYAATTDATRRLELEKEILDLRKQITDETRKAAEATIDLGLARLDDAKADREAARARAQAQNVIDSASTSGEQKAAARDVIARLDLENRKREQEIAELERKAGQTTADTTRPTFQGGPAKLPQLVDGALPVTPVATPATPPAAIAPVDVPPPGATDAAGFAEALRSVLDGATLQLDRGDGTLTPAILRVAAARAQVSKR